MAKANPGKYITGPVSLGRSTAEQGLMQLASGITSAYGQTLELGMKRDLMQQALIDKENLSYQNMYDKINKIPETGVANLDKNINSFFNTNADKIFEIKKHMKNGDVSLQEGNKAIQQLTNYIDEYADLAPKMIAQAQYMKEAMKDGTLSRVNVDGLTAMMMGIADNSADIELVEKDGQMYLTGSGNIKTSEGDKPWNYNINLAEFKNIVNKEGYTIARTVPTMKDIGLDAMFEANKGLLKGAISYEKRYNPNTQMDEYIEVYDANKLQEMLVGRGVFKDLLRSNDMDTVWADVINRGQDASWVKENQWDPNNAEMAAQAEKWFVDQAVQRNIPPDQITQMQTRPTKTKGTTGVGTSKGFGYDAYINVLGLIDERVRDATFPGQFSKEAINLDDASRYLTIMNDKNMEFLSLDNEDNLNKLVTQMSDNKIKTPEDLKNKLKSQGFDDYGNLIAFINTDGELEVVKGFDGTVEGMLGTLKKFGGLSSKEKSELTSVINNISTYGGDIQKFEEWYDGTAADAKAIEDAEEEEMFSIYLKD